MNNTEAKTNIIREQCIKNNVCVCYVNLTGGQDEIVFDGESLVMDHKGDILYKAPSFKEGLLSLIFLLRKDRRQKKRTFLSRTTSPKTNRLLLSLNRKNYPKRERYILRLPQACGTMS